MSVLQWQWEKSPRVRNRLDTIVCAVIVVTTIDARPCEMLLLQWTSTSESLSVLSLSALNTVHPPVLGMMRDPLLLSLLVVVVVVLVCDTSAFHTKIRINTPKLRDNPHLPLLAQNQRES